jgi:hypothetical protein
MPAFRPERRRMLVADGLNFTSAQGSWTLVATTCCHLSQARRHTPPSLRRRRCEVETALTLPPFAIPRCSSLQYQKMLPAPLGRENSLQHLETITKFDRNGLALPAISENHPAKSQIAGRCARKTGSLLTASSARQCGLRHSTGQDRSRRRDITWKRGDHNAESKENRR